MCFLPQNLSQQLVLGVEPRYMGISPIFAIPKLLQQVGLSKEDIDVYEVRGNAPGIERKLIILHRSMRLSRHNSHIV